MEENAAIISGYLKFKAGLLNKWSTGFCQISKDIFTVHRNEDVYSEPLYQFNSQNSWVSAKNGRDTGLFALNAKLSSEAPSKTFLFDAVLYEELQAWLQGFAIGGWGSAVVDKKLHYHRRSIDSGRDFHVTGVENEAEDHGENEVRYGKETVVKDGNDDRSRGNKGNGIVEVASTEDANLPREIKVDEEHRLGPFVDINGNRCVADSHVNSIKDKSAARRPDFKSRYSNISKPRTENSAIGPENMEAIETKDHVRRCASQPVQIRRHAQETRFDHSKIFFDPTIPSNAENDLDFKRIKTTGSRSRKSSLTKKPLGSSPFLESEESSVFLPSSSNCSSSKPTSPMSVQALSQKSNDEPSTDMYYVTKTEQMSRVSVQAPNDLSCEKTSSVKSNRTKNEQTSDLEQPSTDVHGVEASSVDNARNEKSSPLLVQPKNQMTSDFFFGSSEPNNISKLPSTAASHERERYLNADVPRARKCSSVASEGVADMNVDMDGEASVFSSGHHGGYVSYLESGYCSKESLATSESLDSPKSPPLSFSELKIVETGDDDKSKDSTRKGPERNEQDLHDSATNNNERKEDHNDVPSIAVTGRAYSDSKMTPRLARPAHMKMEKRSSMSQLLSQIKGKLPGRKPKSSRKSIKRGQINFENSESVLWRLNGGWKERWISVHGSCLLLFKDSSLKTPDFALDIRECSIEASEEKLDGHSCVKLIEKNGKDHTFAAATEDAFSGLLDILKGITGAGTLSDSKTLSDSQNTDDVDGPDSEEITFQEAIVPYSESESYQEVINVKSNSKQMSVDSGNDGDVSCFEASDASTIGIDAIASERKEKIERRRKTSILLQRHAAQDIQDESSMRESEPATRITQLQQRHKRVTYAESSPPTPTRSKGMTSDEHIEPVKSDSMLYQTPEYLNVEIPRKLKPSRYSVPDFRKNSQQMLRHRSSCLEEVMKLKEAHENNTYPEKPRKIDRNRSTSWYIPKTRITEPVTDENDNHQPSGSWDGLVTSSPVKSVASESQKRREGMDYVNNNNNNNNGITEDFEEELKQQTLLMKRRNSLRLRKEVVSRKVKQIRETLEKNKREMEAADSQNFEKNLTTLEDSLSDINSEIDSLNDKINVPTNEYSKDTKKSKQLFYKLKNTHKSSQNSKDRVLTKETIDTLLTSPGLSPRLRKRSFTQNLKMIGNSLKRNSESSEPNSNRESMSSMDSSNDILADARDPTGQFAEAQDSAGNSVGDLTDAGFLEVSKDYSSQERLRSSPIPPVLDEIDSQRSIQKRNYEGGISKDALLEIEEFEKFAVQLAAKSFTECIDV